MSIKKLDELVKKKKVEYELRRWKVNGKYRTDIGIYEHVTKPEMEDWDIWVDDYDSEKAIKKAIKEIK